MLSSSERKVSYIGDLVPLLGEVLFIIIRFILIELVKGDVEILSQHKGYSLLV